MKKLYKNRAEGKISGVCQGVAEYFSIDPSIVRVLWVALSIPLMGLGIFLYIACIFILPDKSDLDFDDYTIEK